MNKIITAAAASVLVLSIAGCGADTDKKNSDVSKNDGKLIVYTSFYAMEDFVKEIGGDKIETSSVCPVGTEPHEYEPTAADMANLTDADVFVYNGMGMEHWVDGISETLTASGVTLVNASEKLSNSDDNADPHVWLNPENALKEMESIYLTLSAEDSENADYYAANYSECEEKINTLISDYKNAVEGFSQKTIITSHQAYFAICDAFGLTQMAVNSVDNEQEATPTRISEIESFIKSNNVKYIFTEPLGSSSVMDSIAKDTGCGVLKLDPFEGNTENKNYFTVMNENLEALKKALE